MNGNSLVGLSIAAHCSAIMFIVHCRCFVSRAAPFDPMHVRTRPVTLTILKIDPGPGAPTDGADMHWKMCIFTFDLFPFIFIAEPFWRIDFVFASSLTLSLSP